MQTGNPRQSLIAIVLTALVIVNLVGMVTAGQATGQNPDQASDSILQPLTTETAAPTETATLAVTEAPTASPTSTQTPTTVPGTLAVVNSGFEVDADNNGAPDGWSFQVGAPGKRVCNKLDRPGKPDKIVAHQGSCAVEFKGGNGRLTQTLVTPFGGYNYLLYISAFSEAKNLTAEYKVRLKYTYMDSVTDEPVNEKYFIPIDTGTYSYTWRAAEASMGNPVTKAKLQIRGGAGTGRLRLDDVLVYTYQDTVIIDE